MTRMDKKKRGGGEHFIFFFHYKNTHTHTHMSHKKIHSLPQSPFQFNWKKKCYTHKNKRLYGVHGWIEREFTHASSSSSSSSSFSSSMSFIQTLNSSSSSSSSSFSTSFVSSSVGPTAVSKSKGYEQGRVVDHHASALVDGKPLKQKSLQHQALSPSHQTLFTTMLHTHPKFRTSKQTGTLWTQIPFIHPSALRCYHLLSQTKKMVPVQSQVVVGSLQAYLGTGIDQVWYDPKLMRYVIVELKMCSAKGYTDAKSNTKIKATLKAPFQKKASSPFNLHQLQAAINLWLFQRTFEDCELEWQQQAVKKAIACVVRVDTKQADFIPLQPWAWDAIQTSTSKSSSSSSSSSSKPLKRKRSSSSTGPRKAKKRKTASKKGSGKTKKKTTTKTASSFSSSKSTQKSIFSPPLPRVRFPCHSKTKSTKAKKKSTQKK